MAEAKSAFVDGALADHDRERLLAHLVWCARCRADIAELRRVRSLLHEANGQADDAFPSSELSQRLILIAGAEAEVPLWARPFRRLAGRGMPAARRAWRTRLTAAAVVAGTVMAGTGVVGYVAAPPLELAMIGDPRAAAKAEFTNALAQLPLANDAVNAVMMSADQRLSASQAAAVQPKSPSVTGRESLDDTAALDLLEREEWAAAHVGYVGVQQVTSWATGVQRSATVRVQFEPGEGAQVAVADSTGQLLSEGFVPAPASSRVVDADLLSLLSANFVLSGFVDEQILGRSAAVIEARPVDSTVLRARWWIDQETGMLLREETYDSSGRLTQAAGFTQVAIGATDSIDRLMPRLAVPQTTASLTLSSASALVDRGWFCQDQLAGLSLVRLRSDAGADPGVLHMVYSDGITTTSVFEQKGALGRIDPGSSWDPDLGVYGSSGIVQTATWQSGGTVFTVVTDGSRDALIAAVNSLPHLEPYSRTTMDRIQAGWTRIVQNVIG